jgi:Tfp pilus assembly protein PilF
MKNKINKIVGTAAGLVFIGSSVFAQSLADAKKAIDAEQYQKAKSMLKNLTTTQATKDENFFYLGWVYLAQDYPDSAKAVFNKGIAVNAKSALNYAGLGAVARVNKDQAGATTNFNQAISLAGKDAKPYQYVGEGYMLDPAPDANAAIGVLTKGIAVNKDPELYIALGDAYRSQLKSNEAYKAYAEALNINPKSAAAKVATGVLWRYANNWEDSEKEFKDAIAIDPNYGPAYREWAETDVRWAQKVPAQASAKINEAVEQYRKFLSLTDMSVESRLRYADFLYQAGKFKDLQTEAAALAAMPNANARAYRYIAYAAYENGDYASGLTAINNWMSKADPKRIIPYDYLYLGRLQLKTPGKDSLGLETMQKALTMDTTQADLYADVAKAYYGQKKYVKAGDAYHMFVNKSRKATLNDRFLEGVSYYYGFSDQYTAAAKTKVAPDTSLLTKADSAFAYVNAKAASPSAGVVLYRARVNDLKEPSRETSKGLAKPFYEQYIQLITAAQPVKEADKKNLGEAYAYLGTYFEYAEKDAAKATENYTKAREFDPTNKQAQFFFQKKAKPAAKGK